MKETDPLVDKVARGAMSNRHSINGPRHGNASASYYLLNMIYLSVSFFFLFSAFNATQNIVGVLKGASTRLAALSVLYAVFTLSCLAGPWYVVPAPLFVGSPSPLLFGSY